MSFSVDQFMQVKCKFQLTSESESSESIHLDNERVRLCTSIKYGRKSVLIVLVCSNETSNNHILAYFMEGRARRPPLELNLSLGNSSSLTDIDGTITSLLQTNSPLRSLKANRSRLKQMNKPKIIVKQIYYHNYNEDIVAISLSETGHKLVLLNASSTVYIIPIKNILLDLQAQQLGPSASKPMDFYDATMLNYCSLSDPVAVAYWISLETNKSYVIVAGAGGSLSLLSIDDKREKNVIKVDEPIRSISVVRDKSSHSLLITSTSYNQYRITLELIKQQQQQPSLDSGSQSSSSPSKIIHSTSFNKTHHRINSPDLESTSKEPSWDKKPIPIRLHSNSGHSGHTASAVLHRVFVPSNRSAGQTSLLSQFNPRDRSLPLIFKLASNMIAVVDVLGVSNSETPSSLSHHSSNSRVAKLRLLRFYPSNQYCYQPQKPVVVCKLHLLDPDELITHVALTGRFVAIATDRNRCLINSRNCCELKNGTTSPSSDTDPLIKEIAFGKEEKIMSLMKSPITNDPDNIIESFLLLTDRSIYSIEARQSCREMFINLIDSHLAIKTPFEPAILNGGQIFLPDRSSLIIPNEFQPDNQSVERNTATRKNSEASLLIDSFLSHRGEVYETICYESNAFSVLFKLDLDKLYEAYGDRLLQRDQFELANRFYQLAKLNKNRILGKYLRLGLYMNQLSSMDSAGNLPGMKQFKQSLEVVFIEYLNSLAFANTSNNASTLWLNYINFYLNYVGESEELENDILKIIESDLVDCRMAITLYKAIQLDEMTNNLDLSDRSIGNKHFNHPLSRQSTLLETNKRNNMLYDTKQQIPLTTSMNKIYNLTQVFRNEFLIKLLEKTLDLVPQASNLEALAAMF